MCCKLYDQRHSREFLRTEWHSVDEGFDIVCICTVFDGQRLVTLRGSHGVDSLGEDRGHPLGALADTLNLLRHAGVGAGWGWGEQAADIFLVSNNMLWKIFGQFGVGLIRGDRR